MRRAENRRYVQTSVVDSLTMYSSFEVTADEVVHVWQVPRASPRLTSDRLERHIVANLGTV